MSHYFLSSDNQNAPHDRPKSGDKTAGANNAGLRLLDACYDDVAYARYLLNSRLPTDRNIKQKINWKDQQSGVSLLHCFSYSDLAQPMKLLLENNADPNIRNQYEQTPLHWCAKMNSTSCAKLLLDYKADIDAADNSGSTPLHYAAYLGHIEAIMLLLDRGANVQVVDNDSKTPLELSSEGKSNAGKAAYIIFSRHYQRLGLPIPRNIKAKQDQPVPHADNPPRNVNNYSYSPPSTSPMRERPASASPPRTIMDEVRSPNRGKAERDDEQGGRPPSAPPSLGSNHAPRQSSPPAFHFNMHNYRPQERSQSPGFVGIAGGKDKGNKGKGSARNGNYKSQYAIAPVRTNNPSPAQINKLLSNMPTEPTHDPNRPTARSLLHIPQTAQDVDEKEIEQLAEDVAKKLFPNDNSTPAGDTAGNKASQRNLFSPVAGRRFVSASEVPINVTSDSSFRSPTTPGNSGNNFTPFAENSPGKATNSTSFNNISTIITNPPPASKVRKTFADSAFPAANIVPFLPNPQSAGYLDVIICIEHCVDCHLHNDQSLRHDPKKYVTVAVQILYSMIQSLVEDKLKIRVFAMRAPLLNAKRVGAFEVTMAICVPEIEETSAGPASGSQSNMGSSSRDFNSSFNNFSSLLNTESKRVCNLRPQWATHKLFSKLATKSWPQIKAMQQKAAAFVEVTLRETLGAIRDVSSELSEEAVQLLRKNDQGGSNFLSEIFHDEYKHNNLSSAMKAGIEESYSAWQERMKLPLQLVRDPLDLDVPDLFSSGKPRLTSPENPSRIFEPAKLQNGSKSQHPQGPYLDKRLAQLLSVEDFERMTLNHFYVYDNRGKV